MSLKDFIRKCSFQPQTGGGAVVHVDKGSAAVATAADGKLIFDS